MPDFQNRVVARGDAANVATPVWDIEAQITEGQTVLHDFTGANKLRFPQVLSTLPIATQDEIVAKIVDHCIRAKAGLPIDG